MTDDRTDEENAPPNTADNEAFRRHWEQLNEASRPPDAAPLDHNRLRSKFRDAQSGPLLWLRLGVVALTVLTVGGSLLYAVAGTWPVVAGVESGSMEPNVVEGDLVVLTDPSRFAPAANTSSSVVTYQAGRQHDYRSFGSYGSVVVFRKPGDPNSKVIHRAHLRVAAGENWVRRANDSYLRHATCDATKYCPAPHDGFITKGDANPYYDQSSGAVPPVRREWITAVARIRIQTGG